MALDLQRKRANFSALAGGPQFMDLSFTFPSNIRIGDAAINGFDVGYANGDHHLLRTQIDAVVTSISLTTAVVRVTFSLRDSSGTFDDPFSGFVDVLMIVDRV